MSGMEKTDRLIKIAQEARKDCVHSPQGNICPGCIVSAMQRAITLETTADWIYCYQLRTLRKAIRYAEVGIEQAIGDEDGMDGAEGEHLLALMRNLASIKEGEAELALKSLIARAEELAEVALNPQVPEESKKTAVLSLQRALALAPGQETLVEIWKLGEVYANLTGCLEPSDPCDDKENWDPKVGRTHPCQICTARALLGALMSPKGPTA